MALPRDVANQGPRPQTIADQQELGFLQFAWGHAKWRNNLIAKVFCYLSVMRAAGLIADKAKALVSPPSLPVPQDYNASSGKQAAHYLPGFIGIESGGQKPQYLWELTTNLDVQEKIAALFRSTQDLPASYNRADSAAEAKQRLDPPGLKQIFGNCCQYIVDQPPIKSRETGEMLIIVDRALVRSAYANWATASVVAYLNAAARKTQTLANKRPGDVKMKPHTDIAAGALNEWTKADLDARMRDLQRTVHGRKGDVEEFQDQESFLRAYANVTTSEFPLAEGIVSEIETPFSAHKMPSWYQRY